MSPPPLLHKTTLTTACLTVTPRNKLPPHVCYLADLGRSSSRGVNIGYIEEDTKLGSAGAQPTWDRGVADPP